MYIITVTYCCPHISWKCWRRKLQASIGPDCLCESGTGSGLAEWFWLSISPGLWSGGHLWGWLELRVYCSYGLSHGHCRSLCSLLALGQRPQSLAPGTPAGRAAGFPRVSDQREREKRGSHGAFYDLVSGVKLCHFCYILFIKGKAWFRLMLSYKILRENYWRLLEFS